MRRRRQISPLQGQARGFQGCCSPPKTPKSCQWLQTLPPAQRKDLKNGSVISNCNLKITAINLKLWAEAQIRF